MKKYNMGKYDLLVGNNAVEIFDYYKVDSMHGLNKKDAKAEEIDKKVGNGIYIIGWTNYHPKDKKLTMKAPYKPFLFLNKRHFTNTFRDITAVGHEAMHMAILLFNWNIKDREEEVVTLSEEITNKVVMKLGLDKLIKSKPKNKK
jgi:hypothetical protein